MHLNLLPYICLLLIENDVLEHTKMQVYVQYSFPYRIHCIGLLSTNIINGEYFFFPVLGTESTTLCILIKYAASYIPKHFSLLFKFETGFIKALKSLYSIDESHIDSSPP